MIDKLKSKIKELETKKEKLRATFGEYELSQHLDVYVEIKGIDFALKTLKDMLIEELSK